MFEVIVLKQDGSRDIWDGVTEMQAQCLFFSARMQPDTIEVEYNEWVG